jgi:DNA-binding NtrC family response regulator
VIGLIRIESVARLPPFLWRSRLDVYLKSALMTEPLSGKRSEAPLLLVVEEDDGVRRMLQIALATYGFDVLVAADGREAVEHYRRLGDRVDLVLMDVRMEGLSGPETLSILQQLNPDVRCCFMSGDTSSLRWGELIRLGALQVFPKPFPSVEELARTLRVLLPRG